MLLLFRWWDVEEDEEDEDEDKEASDALERELLLRVCPRSARFQPDASMSWLYARHDSLGHWAKRRPTELGSY